MKTGAKEPHYNKVMLIEGIYAAIPTPFYSDERVYLRKLEANVARYSRSLLSGMVVLGSTGEAVTLNDAESREVLRTVAQTAAAEKVLIAGVGREGLRSTLELAEVAAEAQYDAVLVRTPIYYAPQMTAEAILNYYRSIADRSPLPVLLYNIPKFVPYQIPVEIVAELAQHPNIIGIKESSGVVDRVRSIKAATENAPKRTVTVTAIFETVTERMMKPAVAALETATFVASGDLAGGLAITASRPAPPVKTRTKEVGFQILAGAASTVLESLEAGASGAILAFAACAPQACQEIYLAWKDHDRQLAAEKQERIARPGTRISGDLGVSGVKHACDFNGYYGGRPRLPQLPLTGAQRSEVERLLDGIRN